MTLTDLYLYFSQFVPLDTLRKNYLKTTAPTLGAADIQQTVLNAESSRRIPTIQDFLFLGDQDFVLERLRNSASQLFFVDSDRIDLLPNIDGGVAYSLGLTIAEHYTQKNADIISELTIQNRCLETLKQILAAMYDDGTQLCPTCFVIDRAAEIRFFDAKALNGLIGYTAFLTLKTTNYL